MSIWDIPGIELRLRLLHRSPENYTFDEISQKLSAEFNVEVSRNACIGKARRLEMPFREPRPRVAKPKIYKPRAQPRSKHPEGLITIYQLRDYVDCKWPIGQWPDILYCGRQQEEGQVYCPHHCNIAYHAGRK